MKKFQTGEQKHDTANQINNKILLEHFESIFKVPLESTNRPPFLHEMQQQLERLHGKTEANFGSGAVR
jgi:hypothetical protein